MWHWRLEAKYWWSTSSISLLWSFNPQVPLPSELHVGTTSYFLALLCIYLQCRKLFQLGSKHLSGAFINDPLLATPPETNTWIILFFSRNCGCLHSFFLSCIWFYCCKSIWKRFCGCQVCKPISVEVTALSTVFVVLHLFFLPYIFAFPRPTEKLSHSSSCLLTSLQSAHYPKQLCSQHHM